MYQHLIRLNTMVDKILIEDGKAVGVLLKSGEKLLSKNVVSNADPEITFKKLVGEENLPPKLRRKVNKVKYSTSCLSLFMVVDLDLKEMGFDSGNYWFYRDHDIDQIYNEGITGEGLYELPGGLFVTITTLKDPSKMHSGVHTLEVFSFMGYEPFAKFSGEPQGDRSWEYQKLKAEEPS